MLETSLKIIPDSQYKLMLEQLIPAEMPQKVEISAKVIQQAAKEESETTSGKRKFHL